MPIGTDPIADPMTTGTVKVTNLHTVVVASWSRRHLELAQPGFQSWKWNFHLLTN